MNFKKNVYGGGRTAFVAPPELVPGGFELDTASQNFAIGAIIPAGTLAICNEVTRKVSLLKSGRVMSIDVSNPKVVTLEHDEYLSNLFTIGDIVHLIPAEGSGDPTQVTVTAVNEGQIVLSHAIPGLQAGDIIYQIKVVDNTPVLFGTFNAAVINPIRVEQGTNGIDVTKNAVIYSRRVLPVPTTLKTNHWLTSNPLLRYTDSL